MNRLIPAAVEAIPDEETRSEFYAEVIDAFEDADWDTQNESTGIDPVFDATLKKLGSLGEEEE